MDQCDHQINFSSLCRSVTYILWPSKFASCLEDYSRKVVLGMLDQCHSETDFIIKKWCRPGVFVTLWALALVIIIIIIIIIIIVIIIILFAGLIKQRTNKIFFTFSRSKNGCKLRRHRWLSKPEVDFQRVRFVLIFWKFLRYCCKTFRKKKTINKRIK